MDFETFKKTFYENGFNSPLLKPLTQDDYKKWQNRQVANSINNEIAQRTQNRPLFQGGVSTSTNILPKVPTADPTNALKQEFNPTEFDLIEPDGTMKKQTGLSDLNSGENTLYNGITGEEPKKENENESGLRNGVSDILLGKKPPKEEVASGFPSFLNDFKTGFNDNLNNAFQPSNLNPVANKGFAQRLGEAVGTFGRILDNPLARGAIAYGLSRANGDYNSLEQGLTATVGTINNRTADKIYRDNMIQNEWDKIRSMQGFDKLTDEEKNTIVQNLYDKYNNIKGYIGDKVYNNMLSAQQLKDNAEWRKANLLTQQQQMADLNAWRKLQSEQTAANLEYQKSRDEKNAEFEERKHAEEMDYKYKKLESENEKKEKPIDPNEQMLEMAKLYKKLAQNKTPKGLQKTVALFNTGKYKIGFGNSDYTGYDAVADSLATSLARKNGEKGNLSDSDIKRWRKPLPNITDTPEQAQAKFDSLHYIYGFPKINILDKTKKVYYF